MGMTGDKENVSTSKGKVMVIAILPLGRTLPCDKGFKVLRKTKITNSLI
jgi:hypothetical protein